MPMTNKLDDTTLVEIERIIADLPQQVTHSGSVFSRTLANGVVVWIKRAVPTKSRSWHVFQTFFSVLLPLPVLRPTVSKGGPETLKAEHDRIKAFAKAGIVVPNILAYKCDVLVTENAGQPLTQLVSKIEKENERKEFLLRAAEALANMHKAGLCHGRPHLKDMVLGERGIGFLDFEEEPLSVMSLAEAQARDIWIFVMFAARYVSGESLLEVVKCLNDHTSLQTRRTLTRFVKFLKPVRITLGCFKFRSKEIRQSIVANRTFEKVLLKH
jgi:hypothetical protein